VVCKCFVAEMVNKEKAILFHPIGYLLQKILIILHMLCQRAKLNLEPFLNNKHHVYGMALKRTDLEHFDGIYSVIGCFHFKCANICNNDLYILQLKIPTENSQRSGLDIIIVYSTKFAN
jgi:hypothetical protein